MDQLRELYEEVEDNIELNGGKGVRNSVIKEEVVGGGGGGGGKEVVEVGSVKVPVSTGPARR